MSLTTKIELFGWRAVRWTYDRILIPLKRPIIISFQRKLSQIDTRNIEKTFDFSIGFRSFGLNIKPLQIKTEFISFEDFILGYTTKIRNIMEVGTGNGGTLFLFSQLLEQGGLIITLDNYKFPKWKEEFFSNFHKSAIIKIITGSSFNRDTIFKVKTALGSAKLDLLFIDADHTYEGVKNDFEKFAPLVKDDGIIAFHDIVPGRENGVPIFFEELKKKYAFEEFKVKQFGWGGIGVIRYRK